MLKWAKPAVARGGTRKNDSRPSVRAIFARNSCDEPARHLAMSNLGLHVFKRTTLLEALEHAHDTVGYTAAQVCLKPSQSFYAITFSDSRLDEYDTIREYLTAQVGDATSSNTFRVIVHGALVYNLCGTVEGRDAPGYEKCFEKYVIGLVSELDATVACGMRGVVVHMGTCRRDDETKHTLMAEMITEILTRVTDQTRLVAERMGCRAKDVIRSRVLILENSAGEGNKTGSTISQIADILDRIPAKQRRQVKVCIDTAHAYGAGILDAGKIKNLKAFLTEFDESIGIENLVAIHLNDSRSEFGDHTDKHQFIGAGNIFDTTTALKSLKYLLKFAAKHHILVVGEPPSETRSHTHDDEWTFLQSLASSV